MKKIILQHMLILSVINLSFLSPFAQPHLHIERNLEALRLDGNQSWLSFWDGPAYKGFLWNNQGTMTLGTSDENTAGKITFVTNNTERMTINDLGRIGVNTSSPHAPLHVNGDSEIFRLSGGQPYMSYYNGLGGYVGYLWNKDLFDMELGTAIGNNTGRLYLKARGNLGIYMNPDGWVGIRKEPFVPFDVKGTMGLEDESTSNRWTVAVVPGGLLYFYYNNVYKAHIKADDGAWVSASDKRFKGDILPFRSGILNSVSKLLVSTYRYKDAEDQNARSFGFVAQNMREYFPEVVSSSVNEKGEEFLGIAYGKVSVIAIKAIQEQQVEIQKQQAQIQEQQAIIQNQQLEMDQLANRMRDMERWLLQLSEK